MPSGDIHVAMTLGAVAGVPVGLVISHTPIDVVAFATLGALAGLVLTPDLDVDGGCIAHAVVRKFLGRIAATLWQWFWWPYAKIVPHRSPISHSVFGTFIRLAYLALPFRLWIFFNGGAFFPAWSDYWWPFILGLLVSDLLHITADWVVTTLTPRRKLNAQRFRKSSLTVL